MAVSITWKLNYNAVISLDYTMVPSDIYGAINGGQSDEKQIFIEHNGANPLTNCAFYLDAKVSDYSGSFTPAADLAEILSWGNGQTEEAFGGFLISMDAAHGFPQWPTYDDKGNDGDDYYCFRSGVGDNLDNQIGLRIHMNSTPSMPVARTIPANCTVWPSFKCKLIVPSNVTKVGIRQFIQRMRFTYTS